MKLLTISKHLTSPSFQSRSCYSIFSFMCSVLQIVDCSSFVIYLPLCCLSFDIWILITPLVSSNSSYLHPQPEFISYRFSWVYNKDSYQSVLMLNSRDCAHTINSLTIYYSRACSQNSEFLDRTQLLKKRYPNYAMLILG